jgi:hypothetical protein
MIINGMKYPDILPLMASSFFEITKMNGQIPEELIWLQDGETVIDGDMFPSEYHPDFVCPECHRFLFNESEIVWTDYIAGTCYSPLYNIKGYDRDTKKLKCGFCNHEIPLRLFSYLG